MVQLRDDYQRAGFAGSVGFGWRPAVIVVDLVRGYLDPTSPLFSPRYEQVLSAVIEIVDTAHAFRHPVIFTQVSYAKGGLDGGYFWRKVPSLAIFETGSPLAEFDERLRPVDHDVVVTKQYASAFFGTSLVSTLNALAIDTLIVTGVSTSGCVRATAVDALQWGFRPNVVREAVGDRDDAINEANLFDLEAKYADVCSLAEVSSYLGRSDLGVGHA